jgi:molecular chaperone DnaJ
MSREFYVVLGMSPDADLGEIKSVYRKLIRLYHPDVAPQSPDQAKPTSDQAASESDKPVVVDRSQRPPVVARSEAETQQLVEQTEGLFTELDDCLAGWVPGFFRTGRQMPKRKDLYVELLLAPSEASAGGMIPLRVPVERRCPDCSGVHIPGALICQTCQGRGRVLSYHAIEVSVPPGVVEGTRVKLSLRDVGLPESDLNVLVTIER